MINTFIAIFLILIAILFSKIAVVPSPNYGWINITCDFRPMKLYKQFLAQNSNGRAVIIHYIKTTKIG